NINAKIINEGNISFKDAGVAALVAPWVENNGVIAGTMGKVTLASGDIFSFDMYGDKLIEIGITEAQKNLLIKNNGVIDIGNGEVLITASAAKEMLSNLIEINGKVNVQTAIE